MLVIPTISLYFLQFAWFSYKCHSYNLLGFSTSVFFHNLLVFPTSYLSFLQCTCLSYNLLVFPIVRLSVLQSACFPYKLFVSPIIYLHSLQFTCLSYNSLVLPKQNIRLIMGDLNAKFVCEIRPVEIRTMDPIGLGQRNQRRERWLAFLYRKQRNHCQHSFRATS